MKIKTLLLSLLAFVVLTFSSCGPDNEEYADKVVGSYDVKITPNLTVKYEGTSMPVSFDPINTTCYISRVGDDADVKIKINGVNGMINDIEMDAYCSGLGMKVEGSSYDGIIATNDNTVMDCDLNFKNSTSTISNAKILSWNSTVTGKCEMEYVGLNITCNVTGTINYYATYKTVK